MLGSLGSLPEPFGLRRHVHLYGDLSARREHLAELQQRNAEDEVTVPVCFLFFLVERRLVGCWDVYIIMKNHQ